MPQLAQTKVCKEVQTRVTFGASQSMQCLFSGSAASERMMSPCAPPRFMAT